MEASTLPGQRSGAAPAALLLVQVAVGYEWLVSGLSKLARGDFPSGLRGALAELSPQAPSWYRAFLAGVVEPHARAFGYAIELSELAVGIVIAGAAFALLLVESRLCTRIRRRLRLATGAAALVGLVLLVDFELAGGGGFGMRLASDSFDEGVDLDTLLIGVQLALLVPAAAAFRRRR